MSYVLPNKLPQYLVRLHAAYERKGESDLRDVIAACRYLVREGKAHDNWNGGMDGHDVVLFLPLNELAKIEVEDLRDVGQAMCGLLNKLSDAIKDEFFNTVSFELADDNDLEFQEAKPFSQTPPVNPEAVSFWKPGLARVFISHRDSHKGDARYLSDALEDYGVSCFVAHDTIRPMSEWRAEIMKGLQTMEVMLIFLTDDFVESMWCHQEVGFALGKGIPIISLKLGTIDPPGFISHVQALRGKIDQPLKSADDLFPLIGKALHLEERLHDVLVASFADSPSFNESKARFIRLAKTVKNLTDAHVEQITKAFRDNDQLHNSIYLDNQAKRLLKYLDEATGRDFTIIGKDIIERTVDLDKDISF